MAASALEWGRACRRDILKFWPDPPDKFFQDRDSFLKALQPVPKDGDHRATLPRAFLAVFLYLLDQCLCRLDDQARARRDFSSDGSTMLERLTGLSGQDVRSNLGLFHDALRLGKRLVDLYGARLGCLFDLDVGTLST